MTESPPTHPQLFTGRDEPILDPDLPIVDSHHHLYHRHDQLRYLLDEYLADARAGHRVVASVYLEIQAFARHAGPEMMRPLGEIEFANGLGAMAASGMYGDCRACAAIVGHADLRRGAAIGEYLDAAMARAPERFRGIRQVTIEPRTEADYRFITHRPPVGVMRHPQFHDGVRELVRRGLVFDSAVFHHQQADVAALADAFPTLAIVHNHMGTAVSGGEDDASRQRAFAEWRDGLREVARRPNVSCKIGGLGLPFWGFGFNQRTDPVGYLELAAAWKPYVQTAIELFGPQRCMMESNFPVDGRSAGFVPLWNALKHLTRDCTPADRRAMFHDNAVRVYRIDLPD